MWRNTSRLLSVFLFALILVVSACGGSGSIKAHLSVLILQDNPGQEIPTQKLLQQWAKANNVSLSIQLTNLQTLPVKDSTIVQSGSGPDVFMLQGYGPQLYSDSLLDLSDIAQKIGQEDGRFYGIANQVGEVNGVWKALPLYIYMHQLIYRKDILSAIGEQVPATWNDFLRVSHKIETKYGKQGMDAFGVSYGHSTDGTQFIQGVLWRDVSELRM